MNLPFPCNHNITYLFLARLGIYNELCIPLFNNIINEDFRRRHELSATQ